MCRFESAGYTLDPVRLGPDKSATNPVKFNRLDFFFIFKLKVLKKKKLMMFRGRKEPCNFQHRKMVLFSNSLVCPLGSHHPLLCAPLSTIGC